MPTRDPSSTGPVRVLVTGAGGPAAVGVLRLAARADVEFHAADIDPCAAGLYLVPAAARVLVPRGDDPEFASTVLQLCRDRGISVVIPTVDSELPALAAQRDAFAAAGVRLVLAPTQTLAACLDKARLAEVCAGHTLVPTTEILTVGTEVPYPSIVKPREGSGSRGVRLVRCAEDLVGVPMDGTFLVQEYLPGDEFSVDVFVRADGQVVAAVPRTRDRVDSGVAVAGRTVASAELIDAATDVARAIGLRGVGNVQLRRTADGRAALLEVNPRFPGTLVLTAAAGANLAALALADVLGEAVPDRVDFREVAVVRHLAEVVVELEAYQQVASAPSPEVMVSSGAEAVA